MADGYALPLVRKKRRKMPKLPQGWQWFLLMFVIQALAHLGVILMRGGSAWNAVTGLPVTLLITMVLWNVRGKEDVEGVESTRRFWTVMYVVGLVLSASALATDPNWRDSAISGLTMGGFTLLMWAKYWKR